VQDSHTPALTGLVLPPPLLLLLLLLLLRQVMIHQLLMQWGRQGLNSYVRQLQQQYARTAAVAEAAAAQHLADIAEWQPIKAGMFMWVKIKGEVQGFCDG
jgi:DNA-binding transcriptional MocR family regulator